MKESRFSIFFRPFRADRATPEELAFRVSWKRTVRDLLVLALTIDGLTRRKGRKKMASSRMLMPGMSR